MSNHQTPSKLRRQVWSLLGSALLTLATFNVMAADTPSLDAKGKAVESTLQTKFPKLNLQGFRAISEIPGMYEFAVNGQKAYTNSTVDYVLVGELLAKQGDKVVNVTKESLSKDRSQLFADLPKNQAIKIVYGKGERELALFEDPHCPFCETFEADMAARGKDLNATVYVYLFPLESLHPNSTAHAEYIWCSKDPAETWTSWMSFAGNKLKTSLAQHQPQPDPNSMWAEWLSNTHRPESLSCDQGKKVVQDNIQLGYSFNFHSTPILLFDNGTMFPAALPMDKLEKAFDIAAQNK